MRGQPGGIEGNSVVLERALPFLIQALYHQIRSVSYKAFSEHGFEITPEQWIVLVQLWRKDGQSQSTLSELTRRDRPADDRRRFWTRWRRRGSSRRVVDAQDARSRLVKLTRSGRALQESWCPR